MELKTFHIALEFDSLDSLSNFMKDFQTFKEYQTKKTTKKETDRRGSKTHILHEQAHHIKKEKPELSYKECLKLAGVNMRNKN